MILEEFYGLNSALLLYVSLLEVHACVTYFCSIQSFFDGISTTKNSDYLQ